MHSLFASGSCTEGMRLQSTAPPGGVAKESSLIAPETHPPPSASARFCATFWYERGRSNAQDAPIVLYTFAPWVKGGDCGRRTRTKEGRGEVESERKRIATWREQNAFSHNDFTPTPREREGGKGPQKDPHPLISPTLFAVWSFVLKTPSMLRFNYDVTKSHLNFPTTQRPMLSNMIMKGPFER